MTPPTLILSVVIELAAGEEWDPVVAHCVAEGWAGVEALSGIPGRVGATPIPFADAALLVPNQVTMIARITAAYGLPPSTSRALATAGSIVLTGGATMAGRYAVTSLLKFVPGGAVAGSAISAAVAGALTKAVGVAWSRVWS